MEDRHVTRAAGNPDNKNNQEQKSIIESLGKIVGFIDQYTKTLNQNALISEIQEYDDAIKQQDKYFVNQDEKILGAITKSHGTDEFLNTEEKKMLFSQQLRKIMSKRVRNME